MFRSDRILFQNYRERQTMWKVHCLLHLANVNLRSVFQLSTLSQSKTFRQTCQLCQIHQRKRWFFTSKHNNFSIFRENTASLDLFLCSSELTISSYSKPTTKVQYRKYSDNYHFKSGISDDTIKQQGDQEINQEKLSEQFELEFNEMKAMLQCTDKYLMDIITNLPRMKDLKFLKKVNKCLEMVKSEELLTVLTGETSKKKPLIWVCTCFLQTETEELNTFLKSNKISQIKASTCNKSLLHSKGCGFVALLRRNVESKLLSTNENNIAFLSRMLGLKSSLEETSKQKSVLSKISKISVLHLKEKMDFLKSQGISNTDIENNLYMLLMPLKGLDEQIDEMKATLGEVSMQIMSSRYYTRKKQTKYMGLPTSKVFDHLGYPRKKFTKLQVQYIGHVNDIRAIQVIDYLQGAGIPKSEIIRNPYMIGYDVEKVTDCLERHLKSCDIGTRSGQRKLLNLIVYELEFGKDS